MVARGEDSVGALRFIKKLADRGAAATILGNHDLSLIASARGFKKIKAKDRVQDVIDAIDGDELIDWLRKQPLCLFPNAETMLTHAGVPCIWSAEKTAELAQEVQDAVGHEDLMVLDAFLAEMFGAQPDLWSDDLTGMARLRCITNYLTRMRLTTAEGQLEFEFKEGLGAPMPKGYKPWFDYESKAAKTHHLVFGHWAALHAKRISDDIQSVDGGCVWGHQLVAYRLEDQQLFAVENPWIES